MAQRPRAAHPAAPPVVQATAAAPAEQAAQAAGRPDRAQARAAGRPDRAQARAAGRPDRAQARAAGRRTAQARAAGTRRSPSAPSPPSNADRLTLTNFAGKTVTVTVPPNATVTTTSGLAGLKPGAPVSVTGAANPDGSVTATSITSRTTGG